MNRFSPFNDEELRHLCTVLDLYPTPTSQYLLAEATQEESRRQALKKPIIVGMSGIDAPPTR